MRKTLTPVELAAQLRRAIEWGSIQTTNPHRGRRRISTEPVRRSWREAADRRHREGEANGEGGPQALLASPEEGSPALYVRNGPEAPPTQNVQPDTEDVNPDSLAPKRGLFQGPKAAVEFLRDARGLVQAFEGADVSSTIHETAHIFGPELIRVGQESGDAEFAQSAAATEKWLGLQSGSFPTCTDSG